MKQAAIKDAEHKIILSWSSCKGEGSQRIRTQSMRYNDERFATNRCSGEYFDTENNNQPLTEGFEFATYGRIRREDTAAGIGGYVVVKGVPRLGTHGMRSWVLRLFWTPMVSRLLLLKNYM